MEKFDVFIFGTGTAGKTVATAAAKAGMKVAIIDNKEYGGTCSQRGCDPKKLLLASSEALERANSMVGKGISCDISIEWNEAIHYVKRYVKNIPSNTQEKLTKLGVTCLHGEAHFKNEHTIVLKDKEYHAEKIVIATGQMTRPLNIPGAEFTLDSADFFTMENLPKKVVFIGGGYIGMEFAHILSRAGTKVTIIQKDKHILKPFDSFTADILQQVSTDMGINIITGATASSIQVNTDSKTVYYYQGENKHQISADVVFNTSGRIPAIKSLQLENAKVVFSNKGIEVNEYLQSVSQPHIYACGDVTALSLPLTPLSSVEGEAVAHNITAGKKKIEIPLIPSTVFTIPEVASVGLTEKNARKESPHYSIIEDDATKWFNNRRIGSEAYAYKIITSPETDLIIGAHIIGPDASGQINIITLAMNAGVTWTALKKMIFVYPTWGYDIKSFD